MLKIILVTASFIFSTHSFGWGQIGHRIVGEIAQKHINSKTQKNVTALIGRRSLADVATWPDFIKSDPSWRKANAWHYATIKDGKSFDDHKSPKNGDVVWAIDHFCKVLSDKKAVKEDRVEALKFMAHFVGDIHQPLHVGNGTDRGGNDVKINWFNEETNLHRVWDELLIKMQNYSYTEYVKYLYRGYNKNVKQWKKAPIGEWVEESISVRADVYDIVKNKQNYKKYGEYLYNYKNLEHLNKALFRAGIRLAGTLERCLK